MIALKITRADSSRLEAIIRIATRAFSPYLALMDQVPAPMLVDYAAEIERGCAHVALVRGEVVGYVTVHDESEWLLLDTLGVDPAHHGRGIGTVLLAHVEELARVAGLPRVRLCTNVAMTENLAFYPRHGYLEVSRGLDHGYQRVWFDKPVAHPGARVERTD